jgi:hypothetical protein
VLKTICNCADETGEVDEASGALDLKPSLEVSFLDKTYRWKPMFDESSEPSITCRLTAENRDLIVNHAVAVNDELTKKLRMGVVEGKRLGFTFQLHELVDLVDALASEAGHASTRYLRRRFSMGFRGFTNRRFSCQTTEGSGLDEIT